MEIAFAMSIGRHAEPQEELHRIEVAVSNGVVEKFFVVGVAEFSELSLSRPTFAATGGRAFRLPEIRRQLRLRLELEHTFLRHLRFHIGVEMPVLTEHLRLELRIEVSVAVRSQIDRRALKTSAAALWQRGVVGRDIQRVHADLPEDTHGVKLAVLGE